MRSNLDGSDDDRHTHLVRQLDDESFVRVGFAPSQAMIDVAAEERRREAALVPKCPEDMQQTHRVGAAGDCDENRSVVREESLPEDELEHLVFKAVAHVRPVPKQKRA